MKALTNTIAKQMEDFMEESAKALNGNRSAGKRARKLSSSITKELKEYRKVSVEAGKK